jgi:hypothetical protein
MNTNELSARDRINELNQLCAVGYVDTIGLFWGTYPPDWLIVQLRGQYGRNLIGPKEIKYFQDGQWFSRGWRVEINRPTAETLRQLAGLRFVALVRVVACDFLRADQQEADDLQAWLDKHFVQKWRRPGTYSRRCFGTSYSNAKFKARCRVVWYCDRGSKVAATYCAHVEFRFVGAPACRAAGLTLQTLATGIDLRALMQRKTKLMRIDAERRYSGLAELAATLQTRRRMSLREAARRAEGWITRAAYGAEDAGLISIDDLNAQELYDNRLTRPWLKPLPWHLPEIEWHAWEGDQLVIMANNDIPPIDLSNVFPVQLLQDRPGHGT